MVKTRKEIRRDNYLKYREDRLAYAKKRYKENKEYYHEKKVEWLEKNKEEKAAYDSDYQKSLNGWATRKISSMRRHAQKNSYACEIDRDYLLSHVVDECPALKIKLFYGYSEVKGRRPDRATVDRIDSSKGYIKGNIQIISDKANRMKTDATREEMVRFSQWVMSHG